MSFGASDDDDALAERRSRSSRSAADPTRSKWNESRKAAPSRAAASALGWLLAAPLADDDEASVPLRTRDRPPSCRRPSPGSGPAAGASDPELDGALGGADPDATLGGADPDADESAAALLPKSVREKERGRAAAAAAAAAARARRARREATRGHQTPQ